MKCSKTLLFLVFLGHCVFLSWQLQTQCPVVRLQNGRVRARARGRIIRFICYAGYTLVGNMYSTCQRGQWDTPKPVCVNSECTPPPTPENAFTASKYDGAILMYFCKPGYVLYGPTEIYCDGRQWNGTVPTCRATNATAPLKCDFEKPDLCWWEQDPHHDFDWQRHNFETPSSHIGTGPTHDHTLGVGNDGYYLYIEASGRLVNDTARIVSPVYKSSLTESGCFSIWYHMYGRGIGSLQVYFKQKTQTPQLMFSKSGNQGNQWHHGVFNLPKSNKEFQIIIEGVRGSSYVSDIAIDDVAILQGEECNVIKNETSSATTIAVDDDQLEQVNALQSCRGKCSNALTNTSWTTALPPLLPNLCLCTIDCAEYSNCCPDFAEFCVLALIPTDEVITEAAETTVTTHKDSKVDYTKFPMTNGEMNSTTNTVINRTTTTMATTKKSNVPIPINPKDDIEPPTSRIPATKEITKSQLTKVPAIMTTTTKVIQPATIPISREIMYITTVAQTTITKATTHAEIENQPDPQIRYQDTETLLRNSGKISLIGIVALVIGVLTGVSVTMMVAFFIVKKRKNYKRGTHDSALSEDSDVRFLTSDEILDFNLARPSDNDDL